MTNTPHTIPPQDGAAQAQWDRIAAERYVVWGGDDATMLSGPYADEDAARAAIVADAAGWVADAEDDGEDADLAWGEDQNGNTRAEWADGICWATILVLGAP